MAKRTQSFKTVKTVLWKSLSNKQAESVKGGASLRCNRTGKSMIGSFFSAYR